VHALETTCPQHKLRSEFLAMIYFAEMLEPDRLQDLLDDRLQRMREAEAHIAAIESDWGDSVPAGARFVAGFGAALARAAVEYIETHRHLLGSEARPRGVAMESARPVTLTGNRA
jgi:hypothetical protein